MIQVKARPRWKAPVTSYAITEDGRIRAARGTKVRHVTGTSLGALIGCSPYKTPFATQCELLGLNDRDLSDSRPVITGINLEPYIIDYLARKHPDVGAFIPAETIFAKRKGPHDEWESDWDDPDFAGHVDGIVSKDGQDYILEIKTTASIEQWHGRIPDHYLWQVYLYNHFITKQDKAYFGIGSVSQDDYKDCGDSWQPNCRNCMLVEVPIDRDYVARQLESVREAHRKLKAELLTCPYNPNDPIDRTLMDHLRDYSKGRDALDGLVSRLTELNQEIMRYKSWSQRMESEAEELKARLKDQMIYLDISRSGPVSMRMQHRITYDTARAIKDGIDLTPYMTETEVPVISIARQKNKTPTGTRTKPQNKPQQKPNNTKNTKTSQE